MGKGAFGKVYRATLNGETVAIKTLDASTLLNMEQQALHKNELSPAEQKKLRWERGKVESFSWEARRIESISHPFIVGLVGPPRRSGGELMLLLEFCDGGDLEHAIANDDHPVHKISVQWRVLVQLASALLHLHNNGMVHKDLKSENCLLTADGSLKLADLGVAAVDTTLLQEKKEQNADVVERGLKDNYWAAPEEARKGQSTTEHSLSCCGVQVASLLVQKSCFFCGRWRLIKVLVSLNRPNYFQS